MRSRDDKKQEALYLATIKLVNEIGFSASSVAKIAREAGVSPATLYIYFKNKEDLLVSTYLEIKEEMGRALLAGFDEGLPVHDLLHRVWCNTFAYVSENLAEFRYTEQFANSPYSELVDKTRVRAHFEPLLRVIQQGIDRKIIKDVDPDILTAFLFHPIMVLANPKHCSSFKPSGENIEIAFRMAWDALRL
ncbi:TetR/AcrR family transcriptional regulator [Desulfogranum mediterraneum]|uniref:TetR/AcrR family transcriptional regulator n=1 Tax=Desulfogranum mediterraneum TaxID=160661 RepID=UPI0003FFD96C|nr:TetR/AcrR family transcriptional regulator [Desulfogranum mediterraneum]